MNKNTKKTKKAQQIIEASAKNEAALFIKTAKNERKFMSNALSENWMTLSAKERVAIENFLIFYDLVVERLEQAYKDASPMQVNLANFNAE